MLELEQDHGGTPEERVAIANAILALLFAAVPVDLAC
jgi:hypothetical protein